MPIEIKELIVKAIVGDSITNNRGGRISDKKKDNELKRMQKTVELIMEINNEKNER